MGKSQAWKSLEKVTAELLSGIRIHRGGDFSESLPDVISRISDVLPKYPTNVGLVVECKYRAKQPWINRYKKLKSKHSKCKFIVLRLQCINILTDLNDELYILPLDNLKDIGKTGIYKAIPLEARPPGYLLDYCSQPRSYINDLNIRDTIQLLYYKDSNDRARGDFESYRAMSVIGQKHDKLRLACFYKSEIEV